MVHFSRKKPEDIPRRRRVEALDRAQSQGDLEQRYAFRRNQTLTGSASSRVTSLGEAQAHIKSPRVQVHHLASHRRRIGASLVVVVAAAAVLFSLIYQFTASVAVVATPDPSLRLDSSYQATIQSYLQGQPIERLRFLTNDSHLQDYVQAAEPEIESIAVDGSAGFGTSRYAVTLRKPIAGWSINGHQQYVDASGVSFTKNYFRSPAVQIIDNSGVQVADGQIAASNRFLSFVGQVVGLTHTRGLTASKVIIPSGTTRQIELRLKGYAYPVKLSIDRPAGEQVEDMARAVKWMRDHNKTPQYLDVRVSGKAYYR